MSVILETDRLVLREFSLDDARSFFDLNNDPDVIRYTGDEPFSSVEHARQFISDYREYAVHGYGRWACVEKSHGEWIGFCGLRSEGEEVDIGFRFHRIHWGKGYATESAQACLDHGFRELQLPSIIGRASKENAASIRVLEKLGMSYEGDGDCHGELASIYRINNPYSD